MPSITSKDLLENPDLLLGMNIPTETPITNGYSGRVGAVWRGGEYFIISPNMDYIPEPPTNTRASIKTDGRRGDYDPIQWPQQYNDYYCHFSTIPQLQRGLDLKKDKNAILHISFSNEFFVQMSTSTVTGLGHLRPDLVDLMRTWLESYRARSNKLEQNPAISKSVLTSQLAQGVARGVEHMANLPMSRTQMRFLFAHYQRCMLEGEGLISYLSLYQPRMRHDPPDLERARNPPAKIIGSFFTNAVIADTHWRGAIPVWLILPLSKVGAVRVDKVVDLMPSSDYVVLADDPAHKDIYFQGSNTRERHWFFLNYTRSYLSGSNPFHDHSLSSSTTPTTCTTTLLTVGDTPAMPSSMTNITPSSTTTGVIRTSKNQQSKRGQPFSRSNGPPSHAGSSRDKFSDTVHPLLPNSFPAWSSALSSVVQDPRKRVLKYMNDKKGYAFPEPILFVSPGKDEKKALYFTNWLINRSALIYRITAPHKKSELISNQLWRDLLNMSAWPVNAPATSTAPTRGQQRRDTVCQILADCIADNVKVIDVNSGPIQWQGTFIPTGQLPPPDIAREILWEIAEMNFRLEFVGLDKRAHMDQATEETAINDKLTVRDELIGRCFPEGVYSIMPRIADGRQGLADVSWQRRREYIIHFAQVLSTWVGFSEYVISKKILILMELPLQSEKMDEYSTLAVESCLASFYAQTFYNFFGRAPVIPRHL